MTIWSVDRSSMTHSVHHRTHLHRRSKSTATITTTAINNSILCITIVNTSTNRIQHPFSIRFLLWMLLRLLALKHRSRCFSQQLKHRVPVNNGRTRQTEDSIPRKKDQLVLPPITLSFLPLSSSSNKILNPVTTIFTTTTFATISTTSHTERHPETYTEQLLNRKD